MRVSNTGFTRNEARRWVRWSRAVGRMLRLLIVLALAFIGLGAAAPDSKPASLAISGYGLFGNADLKRTLRLLQPDKKPPAYYDANFIEDASLLLYSRLARDGYLKPHVTARLVLADGSRLEYSPDPGLNQLLPRPLKVKRVHFILKRGVLSYYQRIEFVGLRALTSREAMRYFRDIDFLIPIKTARVYTPARLDQSASNLTKALLQKGYEAAKVTVDHLDHDDKTGVTRLRILVREGLPSLVRSLHVEVYHPGDARPATMTNYSPNAAYSQIWVEDFTQRMRVEQYPQGYADATAQLTTLRREVGKSSVQLDLLARVDTGPRITLGKVKFKGNRKTKTPVMRRVVRLEEGGYLDRVKTEEGRQRLSRLGVFDRVEVDYEKETETRRDVLYDVKEGKQIDLSLLFGYGSYELLRGGIELRQYNVLGLAHQQRMLLTQSFKSSSGDYLYTVPEWIGKDVDLFFNASGLRREEISFLREEYGGGIGLQWHFNAINSDVSLRYSYQFLNARDAPKDLPEGVEQATVTAFVLDFKHDKRDNPLTPTEGYNLFSSMEFASAALGGEVDYQRFEAGGSIHFKLGGGRFLHFGLRHGVDLTLGATSADLPFNKRFFPGGENSVRGYQQGEASPLNAEGKIIGAESYLQGNLEFEQALTPAWSIVLFVDGVGSAKAIRHYPFDETLYSVGGGLRWKTIIGPARLEYGYNPDRRRQDPTGTLHFSLGYPF